MKRSVIYVVVGLHYGDEAKGATVDAISLKLNIPLVVRFNGGPQSLHNVVTPEGVWHPFAQFGSATLQSGVKTYLSSEMLIEPENLLREEEILRKKGTTDALKRLVIHPDAAIVTPMHKMIGQMKELGLGKNRVGSCGMGVGEAVYDRERGTGIKVRDFFDEGTLKGRLKELIAEKFALAEKIRKNADSPELDDTYFYFRERSNVGDLLRIYQKFIRNYPITFDHERTYLSRAVAAGTSMTFEGAQGALLDYYCGFHPYVTKTRTTHHNVEKVLNAPILGSALDERYRVKKIGVMRAYSHRHGAGPLVSEDAMLTRVLADPRNPENPWQGNFRVGWLDLLAFRYGIMINDGVDYLAVSHLDDLSRLDEIKIVDSYEFTGDLSLLEELGEWIKWEKTEDRKARIYAFLKRPPPELLKKGNFAKILFQSKPGSFSIFPSSRKNITQAKSWEELPEETRLFIQFLESNEGLGVPVGIVSVGPRRDQRIFISSMP